MNQVKDEPFNSSRQYYTNGRLFNMWFYNDCLYIQTKWNGRMFCQNVEKFKEITKQVSQQNDSPHHYLMAFNQNKFYLVVLNCLCQLDLCQNRVVLQQILKIDQDSKSQNIMTITSYRTKLFVCNGENLFSVKTSNVKGTHLIKVRDEANNICQVTYAFSSNNHLIIVVYSTIYEVKFNVLGQLVFLTKIANNLTFISFDTDYILFQQKEQVGYKNCKHVLLLDLSDKTVKLSDPLSLSHFQYSLLTQYHVYLQYDAAGQRSLSDHYLKLLLGEGYQGFDARRKQTQKNSQISPFEFGLIRHIQEKLERADFETIINDCQKFISEAALSLKTLQKTKQRLENELIYGKSSILFLRLARITIQSAQLTSRKEQLTQTIPKTAQVAAILGFKGDYIDYLLELKKQQIDFQTFQKSVLKTIQDGEDLMQRDKELKNKLIKVQTKLLTLTQRKGQLLKAINSYALMSSKIKILKEQKQKVDCQIQLKEERSKPHIIIPNEFFCPISKGTYTDPVVASDGFTYDRPYLTALFKQYGQNTKSPITKKPLEYNKFYPNINLKKLINDMRSQAGLDSNASLADFKK